MPIIPRVDTPEVGAQFVQTAKKSELPASSFGSHALSGLTEGAAAFMKAKQEVDTQRFEADAENAVLAYERSKQDLFYNPDSGYFNTAGKTAYDNAEDTNKQLADIRMKTAEGLHPNAAKIYNRITNADLVRSGEGILKHAARGNRDYTIATKDSIIENSIEKAALYNADDLTTVDATGKERASDFSLALIAGQDAIIEKMKLQGLTDPALIGEALNDFESAMFASKIQGALTADDVDQAREDFDAAVSQDLLSPENTIRLQASIEAKEDQVYVDKTVTALRTSGIDYKDQVKLVRENEEGVDIEVRDEILRRLENEEAVDKRIESEQKVAMYNDWYFKISREGARTSDIPNEQVRKMLPGQYNALVQLENNIAKNDLDPNRQTNLRVWTDAMDKLRKTPHDVTPYDYVGDMSESDYQIFYKQWASLTDPSKPDGDDQAYTWVRSKLQMNNDTVENVLGTKYDDKKKSHRELNDFISREMQLRVQQEEKGREKLNPTEYQELLNTFMGSLNIEDAGWFWFDADVSLKDIDTVERDTLAQELRQNRIEVNAETLLRLYQSKQSQ